MQEIYSVIYLRPRLFADERISIGIVALSNGTPQVILSDRKVKFASAFVNSADRKYVLRGIKRLEKGFADFDLNSIQLALFNEQVSNEYMKLLGNKRGLVEFSEPIVANKPIDSSYLEYLFKRFVDSKVEQKKSRTVSFKKKTSDTLKNSGIDALQKGYTLQPSSTNNLLTPIKIEGAGIIDGKLKALSIIDFKSSIPTLERRFFDLNRMLRHFNQVKEDFNLTEFEYFVICNPPIKEKQEALYKDLKQNAQFSVGSLKDLNSFIIDNQRLQALTF